MLFKPDGTITSQFYVVFVLLKSDSLIFQVTHNVLSIWIWTEGGGRGATKSASVRVRTFLGY